MKSFTAALCTLLFITGVHGQFQPTPVEKSTQVIHYQGKNYYVHSIKQGQTLYRICKVYEVSEQEIQDANPGISLDPLSVGLILKIPVPGPTETAEVPVRNGGDFILHTVASQETLYSLARQYKVPVQELYKQNPGSEEGIRIGEVIRIPKPTTQAEPAATSDQHAESSDRQQPFTFYKVKPGDTLYRLSQLYDVSMSDLILLNSELRWGLKTDQLLKIPTKDYFPDGFSMHAGITDTVVTFMNFVPFSRYQCDSIYRRMRISRPVRVALILPFFAAETLQKNVSPEDSVSISLSSSEDYLFKGRVSAEIYEGMLLALDTLSRQGYSINLAVYDTEGDTSRLLNIQQDLDLFEPDLILGPLAPGNIELMSRYSFERKIPFVPPLATDDYLFINNPFMFRIIPSKKHEQTALAQYLISNGSGRNIVLAYRKSMKTQDEVERFKATYLAELLKNPVSDTLQMTEIYINDSLNIRLNQALKKDKENIVLVYSAYEPDVVNTLSRLHFLNHKYDLQIIGMPTWQKFESIRIDVIHDLQVSILTPFYIDYGSQSTRNFVQKCRKKLGYEPYMTTSKGTGLNYTYLGYDLGMFFIPNAQKYSRKLCDCAEHISTQLLLSEYDFRRDLNTGNIENSSFGIIKFAEDYTVQIIPSVRKEQKPEGEYFNYEEVKDPEDVEEEDDESYYYFRPH